MGRLLDVGDDTRNQKAEPDVESDPARVDARDGGGVDEPDAADEGSTTGPTPDPTGTPTASIDNNDRLLIRHLKIHATYRCVLVAVNKYGASPPSRVVTATTNGLAPTVNPASAAVV